MGRYKKLLIKILVCFCLVYTPFFANASAVGGWSMGNPVAEGASAIYEGTKKAVINGADYIKKGTAKITPTASQVAKVLRGGAAGYALAIAVEQLLGAVDWVLDSENNQIVYVDPDNSNVPRLWRHTVNSNTNYFNSALDACNAGAALISSIKYQGMQAKANYPAVSGVTNGCYASSKSPSSTEYSEHKFQFGLSSIVNPNYVEGKDDKKTLSLDIVAAKVISNAESETDSEKKAAAQVATMAAAADIVDEASKDQTKAPPIVGQLEASAKTTPTDEAAADSAGTGTGTQTKDPANPDVTNLTLEFPIFCNWAPSVCEAAQTVISFPTTLTDWWNTATTSITEAWTAVKEWATAEPETTDTELDIPEQGEEGTDTNISFDNSCPAPISVPVSWNGNTIHFDFSFDMFCQSFGTYVKPIIIALGAFHAVLIVSGVRINE